MKNEKKIIFFYYKYKMAFSHFSQQNGESHSYMTQEIPYSLKSNANPQAIKTRNRIFQVSSTSQSQNSGGVILFNIPPSNYSITKGSLALRMRVTLTGVGITNQDAATSAALDGPGPIANAAGGAPLMGNGYSVFQRATLYGSNSAIIAQHNFLNDEMNFFLMHNSAATYLTTDASLLLGCGASFNVKSATESFIDLVLPLPFSIFQSSTQDFPAYLMSAPLTIQLDLSSTARAIFSGATAAISEYTVSNTFLLYQAVELPNEMIQAERMAVKSNPFIMTCSNTLAVQIPQSILTSYTLGLNASSIRGAALLPVNTASYTTAGQIKYVRNVTGDESGAGVGVNAQLYFDGNLINSNIVDNVANTFYMLKQFMHHNIQGSVLHPSPVVASANPALTGAVSSVTGLNNFCTNYYAIAFDTASFDEESTIFGGLPSTNVNIQLQGYGANPTHLVTVMIFYDLLVAFGEDGTISCKR
jgi:hypothetical protein